MVSYGVLTIIAVSGFIGMLVGAGLENLMRAANTRISQENEVCNELAQKVLDMQDIILELQDQKTTTVSNQKTIGGQVYTPIEKHDLNEEFKPTFPVKVTTLSKFKEDGISNDPKTLKTLVLQQYGDNKWVVRGTYGTTHPRFFYMSKDFIDTYGDITKDAVFSYDKAVEFYQFILSQALKEGLISTEDYPA